MNLDFSLTKYKELCEAISKSRYTPLTIEKYLLLKNKHKPKAFVIIRHDVDSQPEYALKMARLENKFGITSSYYFRYIKGLFRKDIMEEIAGLGHEIGYHYEVLDKARGDFERAIEIFEEEINEFRRIYDIMTIAPHGSPLMGSLNASSIPGICGIIKKLIRRENVFTQWDNRDLWKKYDFRDYGILGDAYLSIDFGNILYLSDTGRDWSSKHKMKDLVRGSNFEQIIRRIRNTDDIINLIRAGNLNMCILAHPNQWKETFGEWLNWLLFQHIRNCGKTILKLYYKEIS